MVKSPTEKPRRNIKPDLVSVRERGIGYWFCSILSLNGTAHRNTKTSDYIIDGLVFKQQVVKMQSMKNGLESGAHPSVAGYLLSTHGVRV